MRIIRENMIDIYLEEAFERDLLEVRLLGRRHFILNNPDGIKPYELDAFYRAFSRSDGRTRRLVAITQPRSFADRVAFDASFLDSMNRPA
jgi:hypothetical protein